MTQNEAVSHWRKRADAELKAAHALLEKNDPDLYGEVLFHSHLALELAMKAAYIRKHDAAAPFTHDLNELADLLQMTALQKEKQSLEDMTECAILARYGDEEWFAVHATKEKARECLEKAKRFLSLLPRS